MSDRMGGMENGATDLLMIGAEEAWEVMGLGTRGPLLTRSMARSERVRRILVVNISRSVAGRIRDRARGVREIETIYPVVKRGLRWSLVRIGPKHFMLNTTMLLPEGDWDTPTFEARWMLRVIRKAVTEIGLRDPIVWITNPRIVNIARRLESRLRVFDTEDNLLQHPQNRRFSSKIRRGYSWAGESADRILLLSGRQRGMFGDRVSEAKFLVCPNGVDPSLFVSRLEAPEDIPKHKGRIVLYAGVLQQRLDVGLLHRVASELPEYCFVLIGPDLTRGYFEAARRLPNVLFLGLKHHAQLPAYLQAADVCIVPHKVDKLTDSMEPLKIYEYLACGKPVVATPVAGTEKFMGLITTAADPAAFAAAIRAAISGDGAELTARRKKYAESHSWDIRAAQILNFLHQPDEARR